MESTRPTPPVPASKLWEFDRLGTLMGASSRHPGKKPHGCKELFHHYDIREDSLMEETDSVLSVVPSEMVVFPGFAVARTDTAAQTHPLLSKTESGSQTVELPEETNDPVRLASDVISLEFSVSNLERELVASESQHKLLMSRMSNALLFEPVFGTLSVDGEQRLFYLYVDRNTIDVLLSPTDPHPSSSCAPSGANVKVSVRARDMLLYCTKSLMLIIHVGDILRYKKILFTFRSLGLPVTLVDIPQEAVSKVGGDLDNPRRQIVRDS